MRRENHFFGYKAVIGAFLVMFVNLGVASTLGVFVNSLAEYSGWDLGTVGLIGTVNTIGNIILSVVAVRFMGRFGTKITMIISIVMLALHANFYCFVTPGRNIQSLAFMYIAGFLASFAITFGTHAVCATVIAQWFVEKREQLTGIVFSGAGFGAAIWVFLAGQLFKHTDYKGSYRIISVLALIIGLAATIILIRDPDKMGQKPLGWKETDGSGAQADVRGGAVDGIDKKTAMRSVSFWLLAAALLCVCAAGSCYMAYAPAWWQANGWSASAASSWDALYLILGGIVLLVSGKMTEKVRPGVFAVMVCAAYIIAALCMAGLNGTPAVGMVLLTVIFGALAYPLSASIPGLMGQSIFGMKDAAAISAALMTAVYCGQALYAPIVAAFLKGAGFAAAWIFFAVAVGVGMILILLSIAVSPLKKIT